ncbi:protein FAR1-RELATED SEQUENCE 5-like [Camellia sinensis]|uniref:protein FAR1-RELATED SEQUENCE 5-like n=1 Tax=Camellia sinensis TaxID=4442 RepID=UPI0010368DC9|nr:protein FAR1-RELATED SEQUENCE 5-like [Camellia sinensis]
MDYAQFGDVVTFDTTYKLNNEHRPFGTFVGFNHHREIVISGVVLMYDETAESFTCCSCKKFEVKGILCRHCLKVLRDILNATKLPAQYILNRWTKKEKAESVKDNRGYDIKANVKLHQSDQYRSLTNMFRAIASRAAESEETYHLSLSKGEELSVMVENKLSVHICGRVEVTELRNSSTNTCPQSDEVDCPIQVKGIKKRQATCKGRRRIKGRMEKSIAKKKMMQYK